MKNPVLPPRNSLTRRLLLMIVLAAVLPLLVLTVTISVGSYQVLRAAKYEALVQSSRRMATDFESRLNAKLGLVRGAVLALQDSDDPSVLERVLGRDPDFIEVWVRFPGREFRDEAAHRQALFKEVRARGTEFLSAPNFDRYQASLGVPLFRGGQFAGMVGVSFSLQYFQDVVVNARLFQTGYSLMVSHEGLRLAHPDRRLVGTRIGSDVSPEMAQVMLSKVAEGQDFWFEKKALLTGKWSRQFYSAVRVGQSPAPWFLVMVVPEEEAVADVNKLFFILTVGILATLALVAGTVWIGARSVVRPLKALAEGAEAVAAGNRDVRVVWASRDELGALAQAFNRMTDQLVQTLRDQEDLVRQRTASLRLSLETLEKTQEQLVESGKLAVLGQLTATIAHDINTPLGAIRSSAMILRDGIQAQFGDLPAFFRSLDPPTLAWYRALVVQKGVDLAVPAAQGDRPRRRRLAQQLRALGESDPEGLAEDIAFLVSAGQDEAILSAVGQGKGPVLRRAAETSVLLQSSSIIVEAADRAASTVAALVDYARVQNVQSDQDVDPARELETILTLYYGLSKRNVEVIREYEPGLTFRGDRDKLNQVWENLIKNALQAMGFRGKLRLRTRRTPEGIETSVSNDGPPVPPELRERIFEPFFTTKKPGEGTGLGLDICRRIVGGHGGTLTLSEEGTLTVFTVRLPHPAPEAAP